ncbi:MAG: DUF3373 family protein [Campylobacterota bacterium]|nr:DUF3373 family protein [Campylobacterota bacterium]
MKKIVTLSAIAFLSTSLFANVDMQTQIDELTKEVKKLKKVSKSTKKSLSGVKKATGGDNIKFGLDFRNTVDVIDYSGTDANGNKIDASNSSLLTSRLFLTMASSPMQGLMFKGKLAIYSTWGAHVHDESTALKSWSGSSKATDTIMRIKEAYFVYSNSLGEQPISFSVGRRPATNGVLANYRENEPKSGSPVAHVTNMEVDGAMIKLDTSRFVEGSYSKFVYGRAHSGEMEGVYGNDVNMALPFADLDTEKEDENVDFFTFLGNGYYDGQYQLSYQWSHIFDTKGKDLTLNDPAGVKNASGAAELVSLSLKVEGIGDEISDFLDETTVFISGAYTSYSANDGYSLLGSADGGSQSGTGIWVGAIIPDGFTDAGKFGLEYNQGSQYFTPITWAEDTAIGSKIAVRGSAYEAYWNFNLFGVKYLPSQVRATYVQHDYTPNNRCAGWIAPVAIDMTATDLRLAVSYRY